ncbi:hypothetical protein CON22_25850 [Bacillus cereus]|nr:hypothetical protein CON22_25850 [Bacillus cereus]
MHKVSIIVPCFNVEKYLRNFMNSMLHQKFESYEVIFVNDGSTDNTLSILKEFSEMYSFVRCIDQENSGSGIARNSGLRVADGEYVCFFDPDDTILENTLKDNYEIAKKHDIEVVLFGINVVDEKQRIRKIITFKDNKLLTNKNEMKNSFSEMFFDTNIFSPCNKMYLRKFLMKNNLEFPMNRTGQDSLFNIKMWDTIPKTYINTNSYYFYLFGRTGSATKQFDQLRILDDMQVCKEFREFIIKNDFNRNLWTTLTFQKVYKLSSIIKNNSREKLKDYTYLYKQAETMKILNFSSLLKVGGAKNKLKLMYLFYMNAKLGMYNLFRMKG